MKKLLYLLLLTSLASDTLSAPTRLKNKRIKKGRKKSKKGREKSGKNSIKAGSNVTQTRSIKLTSNSTPSKPTSLPPSTSIIKIDPSQALIKNKEETKQFENFFGLEKEQQLKNTLAKEYKDDFYMSKNNMTKEQLQRLINRWKNEDKEKLLKKEKKLKEDQKQNDYINNLKQNSEFKKAIEIITDIKKNDKLQQTIKIITACSRRDDYWMERNEDDEIIYTRLKNNKRESIRAGDLYFDFISEIFKILMNNQNNINDNKNNQNSIEKIKYFLDNRLTILQSLQFGGYRITLDSSLNYFLNTIDDIINNNNNNNNNKLKKIQENIRNIKDTYRDKFIALFFGLSHNDNLEKFSALSKEDFLANTLFNEEIKKNSRKTNMLEKPIKEESIFKKKQNIPVYRAIPLTKQEINLKDYINRLKHLLAYLIRDINYIIKNQVNLEKIDEFNYGYKVRLGNHYTLIRNDEIYDFFIQTLFFLAAPKINFISIPIESKDFNSLDFTEQILNMDENLHNNETMLKIVNSLEINKIITEKSILFEILNYIRETISNYKKIAKDQETDTKKMKLAKDVCIDIKEFIYKKINNNRNEIDINKFFGLT